MLVATSGRAMAGAIEGALLALALASVMRRFGIGVRPVAWVGAVVLADVLRWQIPIPGAPYNTTGGGLLIKGIADGLVIGIAQTLALDLRGALQKLWVGASVAGWVGAIFAFDAIARAFISTIVRAPLLPATLIGAAAGVAVGAATCVLAPLLAKVEASEASRASTAARTASGKNSMVLAACVGSSCDTIAAASWGCSPSSSAASCPGSAEASFCIDVRGTSTKISFIFAGPSARVAMFVR